MAEMTAPLALVRVRAGWLRSKVLALSGDHAIVGYCGAGARSTSDLAALVDEKSLLDTLSHSTLIPLSTVNRICVDPPMAHSFLSRYWNIKIHAANTQIRFRLAQDEHAFVIDHLENNCTCAVSERTKLVSFLSNLLFRVALAALLLGGGIGAIALGISIVPPTPADDRIHDAMGRLLGTAGYIAAFGAIGLLISSAATLLGALLHSVFRPSRKQTSEKPHARTPSTPRKRMSFAELRLARAFGWMLKATAIGYYVAAPIILINLPIDPQPADGFSLSNTIKSNPLTLLFLQILVNTPLVLILYWSYRLTAAEFKWDDDDNPGNAPVLFLRSFDDDIGRSLHPNSYLARFSGVSSFLSLNSHTLSRSRWDVLANYFPVRLARLLFNVPNDTAEEALAKRLRAFGPTIAVGAPAEFWPTPGFSRTYFRNEEWKDRVRAKLSISRMVVIQCGMTDGIAWEIGEAFRLVERRKILLSMVNFCGRLDDYDRFRRQFARVTGILLPVATALGNRAVFVFFNPDGQPQFQQLSYLPPLLWPYVGSIADLDYSLAPFLQSARESRAANPRPVRHHRAATVVAWIALPIAWLVLSAVPQAAIMSAYATLSGRLFSLWPWTISL